MASPSSRFILKSSIQTAHNKLESLDCHKRIFAMDYTLGEYGNLLRDYLCVLSVYDKSLQAQDWGALTPYTSRIPLLLADLNALNHPVSRLKEFSPDLDIYGWWGVRYVLEGMSLGGKVMIKNAPIFKQRKAASATSFLSIDSHSWPIFCRNLDAVLATPDSQKSAVYSANLLLENMINVLDSEEQTELSPIVN